MSAQARRRQRRLRSAERIARLEQFDLNMVIVIAGLVIAIGLVIVHGDQVGLSVRSVSPSSVATGRDTVRVTFEDPVVVTTAASYFTITPPVPGKLTVSSDQISFQPAEGWQPDQQYTVTVRAGMQASSGRTLKQDVQWNFHARPARVAYLGPVDNIVQNLYILDPAHPEAPQQLTNSAQGLVGFDVIPDGSGIIYAQLEDQGAASLWTYEFASGQSRLLYKCKNAACSNPVFRPDGGALAFERVDLNSGTGMSPGVPRVWVLNLAADTAAPLFQDNQQLGYMPRWSPDGTKLAVFNTQAGGIVVHDYKRNTDTTIVTVQGEVGYFSPDGRWLFFPKIVELPGHLYATHLVLVDLSSPYLTQHDLVPDSEPGDDVEAIWQPDSKHLIVARRPPDARSLSAPQLFNVDVGTTQATPLVVDNNYSQSDLSLSPGGDALLFQRFQLTKPGARTELWTYNLTTHVLKQIAEDASFARWVP